MIFIQTFVEYLLQSYLFQISIAIDPSSFIDFHFTHANTNTSDLGDDGVDFRYILLDIPQRCERTVGRISAVFIFKDLCFSVVVVILTLAFIYQSIIADGRFANLNKK